MYLRHFIITYGPTGSGKGHVRSEYEKQLRELYPDTTPERYHYVESMDGSDQVSRATIEPRMMVVEIDNFVEGDNQYIIDTTNATREFIATCGSHDIPSCMAAERVRMDGLVRSLSESYFRTRKFHTQRTDDSLVYALRHGWNVVFETTGMYGNFDWLFDFLRRNTPSTHRYIVTVIFPITDSDTIVHRVQHRFVERVQCIRGNREQCFPPRLLDPADIRRGIVQSHKNLMAYVTDKRVDHLFLYNNTARCEQTDCLRVDMRTLCKENISVIVAQMYTLVNQNREMQLSDHFIRTLVRSMAACICGGSAAACPRDRTEARDRTGTETDQP